MNWDKWDSMVAPGGMILECVERKFRRKLRCIAAAFARHHAGPDHPLLRECEDFFTRAIDGPRNTREKVDLLRRVREEISERVMSADFTEAPYWFAWSVLDARSWRNFPQYARSLIESTCVTIHFEKSVSNREREDRLARAEQLRTHRRLHAELVADIVYNPFASAQPQLGFPLVGLAGKAVYDTALAVYRSGDPLAVLALNDALLEAGCDDESLLTHLSSRKYHPPGCWLLDLILGKPSQ